MKPWRAYRTSLPFPKKAAYTKLYAYREGETVWSGDLNVWNMMKGNAKPHYGITEKVVDLEAYKAALEEYRLDELRLKQTFKRDLEDEYDTYSHPKAQKLFDMAWERGHAKGHQSIAAEYAELAELLI